MAWVLAVPGGLALGVGLWAAWVRYVEHGLFAGRPPADSAPRAAAPPPPPREPLLPPGEDGHLAFARALHRAATMNLEECEARADARRTPRGSAILPRVLADPQTGDTQ